MKKNVALLLALAMVMMIFAGCGNTAASAVQDAASAAQSAAEQAEEAVTEAAEDVTEAVEPAAEAEGSAVEAEEASAEPEFEGNPPIEYPLVDEPTTLTYWQA